MDKVNALRKPNLRFISFNDFRYQLSHTHQTQDNRIIFVILTP